jgi:hypothetical protein
MPAAGQAELLSYVNGGGGLVTSEWTIWKTAEQADFGTLSAALPVIPNTAYSNGVLFTYSVVTPNATLNSGVPSSFSFTADPIAGTSTQFAAKPGATTYYTSNLDFVGGSQGLIGWGYGAGHVISFSTVAGPGELGDPNYGQLFGNAVAWSTGATGAVPEPSSLALGSIAAAAGTGLVLVHRRRRTTV